MGVEWFSVETYEVRDPRRVGVVVENVISFPFPINLFQVEIHLLHLILIYDIHVCVCLGRLR